MVVTFRPEPPTCRVCMVLRLSEAVEMVTHPVRDTGAAAECLHVIEPGVWALRCFEGACHLDPGLPIDHASAAGVLEQNGCSIVSFEEQPDVEMGARRCAGHPIAACGGDMTGQPRTFEGT